MHKDKKAPRSNTIRIDQALVIMAWCAVFTLLLD